eukprot:352068-Chlamydomonas_euryale.AAC.6
MCSYVWGQKGWDLSHTCTLDGGILTPLAKHAGHRHFEGQPICVNEALTPGLSKQPSVSQHLAVCQWHSKNCQISSGGSERQALRKAHTCEDVTRMQSRHPGSCRSVWPGPWTRQSRRGIAVWCSQQHSSPAPVSAPARNGVGWCGWCRWCGYSGWHGVADVI